jgi:hypothetical protein
MLHLGRRTNYEEHLSNGLGNEVKDPLSWYLSLSSNLHLVLETFHCLQPSLITSNTVYRYRLCGCRQRCYSKDKYCKYAEFSEAVRLL